MAKQRNWGSALAMLAFAGFIATSLWAKWNPASAQDQSKTAVPAKPADAAHAKDAKGKTAATKQKTKSDAAKKVESNRPIPGAGKKLDALALAKIIDQEVQQALKSEGIKASSLAEDAEFYRRVHLDLVGVVPTPDKVMAFLDSKDRNKRQKAIDELLADERFGKSLAEVWTGLTIPRESNNRALNRAPFQQWLAKSFNENKPLDRLVSDILTSTGTLDENGAVGYFVGNPTVDKMTDNVAKMFLGVRLECAQCHNHPFVNWKQDEYWGMAAFFMKTKLTVNPQQAAKKGVSPGIMESGGPAKGKKGNLPESAKFVPAKFLQAEKPKLTPSEPYRPVLAKWITSPDNPFFARAIVNRFWYQMFGRGLVNPVDDMHEENEPSHPELLAALTEQFKTNGFDLKYLIKAICNSEAYQRTSRPTEGNADDKVFYSHRAVRVFTPEQLYDSMVTVLGQTAPKRDVAAPKQKGVPGGPREAFLAFFRVDEPDPQDYQAGIPQALRLMNSGQTNATQNIADQAIKSGGGDANKTLERLFLVVLSRPPTQPEMTKLGDYVKKQSTPRQGYSDVVWALMNSTEFTLNH
jgi:Protein of unknown function (DUF1549)/Protein of unknown function (DUF1553)